MVFMHVLGGMRARRSQAHNSTTASKRWRALLLMGARGSLGCKRVASVSIHAHDACAAMLLH
jgi:hypothetical protein